MLEMKLKSEKKEKENKHAIHTVARFFFWQMSLWVVCGTRCYQYLALHITSYSNRSFVLFLSF
jgi:hypothetical protein